MDIVNEKLHGLLKKYEKDEETELSGNTLCLRGKTVELLPWRKERRFIEMKKLINSEYFNGMSMYRAMAIENCLADKEEVLKREMDLFGYLTEDNISEVYCVSSGAAVNLLMKTERGYIGTAEFGFTLYGEGKETDKHEAIASSGIVCDKAIDTQMRQQSIYLLGKEEETYTDNDFELYGLNEKQVALVRQAFEVITGKDLTDYERENGKLDKLLICAKKSEKNGSNVLVGEVK